jgi:hypothetical protein
LESVQIEIGRGIELDGTSHLQKHCGSLEGLEVRPRYARYVSGIFPKRLRLADFRCLRLPAALLGEADGKLKERLGETEVAYGERSRLTTQAQS